MLQVSDLLQKSPEALSVPWSLPPQEEWTAISSLVASLLENQPAGLLVFDEQLRVALATARVTSVLGIASHDDACTMDVREFLDASTVLDAGSVTLAKAECSAAIDNPAYPNSDEGLSRVDGSGRIAMQIRRIGRRYWMAAFEDVTARREAETKVMQAALRDPLTDLGNRRLFVQTLDAELAKPDASLGVVFIDLDRFKTVNDTLGHGIGDEVLRLVGQRLQSVLRERDCAVRLGGDEFAVIFAPALSHDQTAAVASRMIDLLQRTYLISGHVVNIGASIGIATAPKDGVDRERLLKHADLALYHSKASGRGVYHFFEPEMALRAETRRTLELELRKALPLRQLEVHYLPQIDLANRTLIGLRADLRWRHPERGLLLPAEFMPLADEIHLSVQVGDWVIRTACRDAAQWPAGTVVQLPSSPAQFERGHLADTVQAALKKVNIPGSRLEIGITEDVLLRNEKEVLTTLHRLWEQGVRIAIVQFGTGYASLSQLANFPFDKITIDRSLTGKDTRSSSRAIVQAIATLGANLGITTMAEGLETTDQLERLQSEGCASVHGFLSAKAIPAEELNKFIADGISAVYPGANTNHE